MDKMTGKDKMSSLSAVLGIVLGVLATVLTFNIVNKHNKLSRWTRTMSILWT